MPTAVENIQSSNEKVIDTVKKAQTQFVELNERAAGFLGEKLPSKAPRIDLSFAGKAVDGYFSFVGEMLTTQREFTAKMIDAWTPVRETPEQETAKPKPAARKTAAKTTSKK
jgi:hypothetical protein